MLRVQVAMCVPLGMFDATAKKKDVRDATLWRLGEWSPKVLRALINAPGAKGIRRASRVRVGSTA